MRRSLFPLVAPGNGNRFRRRLTLLLFMVLTAPAIAAVFEWRAFATLSGKTWEWSEIAIVWVFFAKTQVLLALPTIVSVLLIARGWHKTGWAIFSMWLLLVFVALDIDQQAYSRMNVHLREYAKFLRAPAAAQWAGDLNPGPYLAGVAGWVLLRVIFPPLALGMIGVELLWHRVAARVRRRVLKGFAITLAAACVGVAPAQWLYPDRSSLQQVHALLPFDFGWSAPGVRLVDTAAFAEPLNRSLGVDARGAWDVALPHTTPAPAETFANSARPDVVLIIVESLREDAMTPEVMPRLSALAGRGIRLTQHSAGAKFTQFGIYNLLTSRPAFAYQLDADSPSPVTQATVQFHAAGYEAHYLSGPDNHWKKLENFVNGQNFDRVQTFPLDPWPLADHRVLREARRLVTNRDRPHFVTAFLSSTHYPYKYADAFGTRLPVPSPRRTLLSMTKENDCAALINRYHNACAFLDDEIASLISAVDLSHTIVVVTGDHAESFWDDGSLSHGGRWSEVQSHVPCLILGAGVTSISDPGPTFHQDVLPTLLHLVAGRHVPMGGAIGRDLIDTPRLSHDETTLRVLCSEARGTDFSQALVARGNDRVLLEFPSDHREAIVLGTVDRAGNVDPFNTPPARDAAGWAAELRGLLQTLADPTPR